MATIKSQNEAGIKRVKTLARNAVAEQPRNDFGHGYLWVIAHFAGKRGQKFLAASIDGRSGHDAILATVNADPDVRSAWINMD